MDLKNAKRGLRFHFIASSKIQMIYENYKKIRLLFATFILRIKIIIIVIIFGLIFSPSVDIYNGYF